MLRLVDAGVPGMLAFAEDGERRPFVGSAEVCDFLSLVRDDLRRDDPATTVTSFASRLGALGLPGGASEAAPPEGSALAESFLGPLVLEPVSAWLYHSAAMRDIAVLAMLRDDAQAWDSREAVRSAARRVRLLGPDGRGAQTPQEAARGVYVGSRGPACAAGAPCSAGTWEALLGDPFEAELGLRPEARADDMPRARALWLAANAGALYDAYLESYIAAAPAVTGSLLAALQQGLVRGAELDGLTFCRVCGAAMTSRRRTGSPRRYDGFACMQWVSRNEEKACSLVCSRDGVEPGLARRMLGREPL